ncbi:MAG: SPOR domain-containing protein [Candidatus Binatia bacterium]
MHDAPANKNAVFGLITTPSSYYSTPKAKYLGDRYKQNLERMVEQIVHNRKTSALQFANNIATVGGIGFFTHSATKSPDERYLEVVMGVPETFEAEDEHSEKLLQLFSRYGIELLTILSTDSEIYQERELAGYGLNLSWRSVVRETSGARVILERAIVYAPKEKVRSFLRQEISENSLLGEAVIFAARADAPLRLLSYRASEPVPAYHPAVREETIVAKVEPSKVVPKRTERSAAAGRPGEATKAQNTPVKNEKPSPAVKENAREAAPAAAPPQPSISAAKATSVGDRLSSPRQGDVSGTPATKEPSPGKVKAEYSAAKPAEPATVMETKKKTSEPVANIAKSAVKPDLEAGRAGAAPRNSMTETAPAQPRASKSESTEKVNRAKPAEKKSPTIVAKQTTDGKSSPSRVAQDKQPVAKAVAPKLERNPDAPQPKPAIAAKSKHNQPFEEQGDRVIALKPAHNPTPQRPPAPRFLEGYIIQLAFAERIEAQRWAERLGRRGYAVSLTMPDSGGAIRVRIGNFSEPEDAERQLKQLRQDGLSGIVVNLPQAYRPEVQRSRIEPATSTEPSHDDIEK